MDLIRQQLEFEVQQVRSVMEERFGTNQLTVQRTQVSSDWPPAKGSSPDWPLIGKLLDTLFDADIWRLNSVWVCVCVCVFPDACGSS